MIILEDSELITNNAEKILIYKNNEDKPIEVTDENRSFYFEYLGDCPITDLYAWENKLVICVDEPSYTYDM